MKGKRYFGLALALAISAGSLTALAFAADSVQDYVEPPVSIERAIGNFSVAVSSGKSKKIGSSFYAEAGEIVTINASYTPRSASVDFGLTDSNNKFHFINVTSGSINSGIEITQRGEYTLTVRNNATTSIDVSGYIDY